MNELWWTAAVARESGVCEGPPVGYLGLDPRGPFHQVAEARRPDDLPLQKAAVHQIAARTGDIVVVLAKDGIHLAFVIHALRLESLGEESKDDVTLLLLRWNRGKLPVGQEGGEDLSIEC